jgi:hypothetical protein
VHFSKDLHKLAVKKRKLWKKLKANPFNTFYRSKYRDCTHQWRHLSCENEIYAEEQVITSNNLGAFYKHVNKRISHRASIGPLIDGNGTILSDDLEKANAFNTYFASVGVIDNNIIPPMKQQNPVNHLLIFPSTRLMFCMQ